MLNLSQRALKHIWYPASQMQDYASFQPLEVVEAYGPYFELANGMKIIDANSSWWCKSLGHSHPRLQEALLKQLRRFSHIIHANTCHDVIVELSEALAKLTPSLTKVFYASEGSSAVEIALKMAWHASQLRGHTGTKVLALKNSYHGETGFALAVSDLALYRKPYADILMPVTFLPTIPYINSKHDPLWQDIAGIWPLIEQKLNSLAEGATTLIVEPIVQGAGGMLLYSKDFLRKLREWTKSKGIYLIADEILTGFGRTGLPLASNYAGIEADFICIGKGLTAGLLPFSAVLTTEAVYDLFYGDYAANKAFLHSHTQGGNALGAAAALETLQILEDEKIYAKVSIMEPILPQFMLEVAAKTGRLTNVRNIGAIVAGDLVVDANQKNERLGFKVFQEAVKLGAFLRPLGNTIYWLPPLNTERAVL